MKKENKMKIENFLLEFSNVFPILEKYLEIRESGSEKDAQDAQDALKEFIENLEKKLEE